MHSRTRASEVLTSPDANRRPEKEGRSGGLWGHISTTQRNQLSFFPSRKKLLATSLGRGGGGGRVTLKGRLVHTGSESSQLFHTKSSSPPPFQRRVQGFRSEPQAHLGQASSSTPVFSLEKWELFCICHS